METGKANNIQAKTFNSFNCKQYHLSVEIGLQSIAYCIINNQTNDLQYFNKLIIDNDFVNIINEEEVLKLNFASSSVAFTNFPCTLVPNEVFQAENAKDILQLNSDIYEVIKSDKLANSNTHLCYTVPSVISDIVFTFFPNASQKAQQTILIDKFSCNKNTDDNVYLYLNENILTITVFTNNKLLFNNSFDFNTKEDILYYTLFTFEQLKINTETVNVILYGDIIKGDSIYQLLYEYIRKIKFGSKPLHINLSSEFNSIQGYRFYALFSQHI